MCGCHFVRYPRQWLIFVLGALLVASAGPALAGQQLQASITGQVTDDNGGVLPGVTVTATSPSLQVPSVVDVTNERGEYRLTPLPIGTYTVVYTLAGFSTLRREELRLTAGFDLRADIVMKIGGLEESVTVSGASPVVDVTSTSISTEFTRETLELSPTSRNGLWSLLAQMPAVRNPRPDVGGMVTTNPGGIKKYGQLGEDWVTLEGVSTQEAAIDNWGGAYIDYASMEEVRAEVVGGDASQPRKGLKLAIITKSGGNNFNGAYSFGYTSGKLQSDNLTDELRSYGFTTGSRIVRRTDIHGDLGGRIIRDKLWFYGSLRRTNLIDEPLGAKMPDGSQSQLPHMLRWATGKLSYQATKGNRFIGFYNRSYKDDWGQTEFTPWESRSSTPTRPYTYKIEWQGIRGNSLAASLQYGKWGYNIIRGGPDRPTGGFWGGSRSTNPATFDQVTMLVTGDDWSSRNSHLYSHHSKGSLTWFAGDLFAGTHEFKTGFEYRAAALNFAELNRPSGNYRMIFNNGVPFQISTYNAPIMPQNPVHNLGLYAMDSWNPTRRVTLNLGLRFARDNRFVPAQCHPGGDFAKAECYPFVQFNIWQSLAPRVHVAYDLTGNGKTLLKGGWARYYQMAGADEVILANRAAPSETTWTWRDLNGNRLYDKGEVNTDPNGPDFISITGTTNLVPDPDEQQPRTDELSVAFEREIMPNFGVRAAGIYHRWYNLVRLQNNLRPYSVYNIPITNRDPGPDGVVGNADDPGTNVTYYDYSASLQGARFVETAYVNDPGATRTFKSLEVSGTKRLSNGWQLMATYSATKKDIPYIFNSGGGNFYPITTLDPNAEINVSDRTWDWQAGVSGAYMLPWQLMTSVNYQVQSGEPFGRTVLFRGGRQIPSLVVRVEPIGTRRMDNIHIVDYRIEKQLTFGGHHKVGLQMNIFNVMNVGTVDLRSDRAGSTFLRPSRNLRPRVAAFNVNYQF